MLATGSSDEQVKLWKLDTPGALREEVLEGLRNEVTSIAFSPDGRRMASGADDKTIKLWDVSTYEEVAEWRGHRRAIVSVAFSPDGSRVAT